MDQETQDMWNRPVPEQERDREPGGEVRRRFEMNPRNLTIFFLLLGTTVFTTWLVGGPWFSLSLLLILGSHEFGHYWACRKNNVDATLPNFIPAPPIFIAGTFGAFIAIKEPIPDRRVLMEIGASGPIAGFVVALPVMIVGLMMSTVSLTPPVFAGGFNIGSSLILVALTKLILSVNIMDENLTVYLHPLAWAGWIGMFFTALNLLPMSQLDGGHIVYALFENKHSYLSRLFFLALLPLGFYWLGWLLLAVLILMMGLKHPPVLEEDVKLEPVHRKLGYASIFIFVITFVPVPFGMIQ